MDWVTCTLCGYRFNPEAAAACGGCPIRSSCSTKSCPHCGYELVPDSVILTWARKLLSRARTAA